MVFPDFKNRRRSALSEGRARHPVRAASMTEIILDKFQRRELLKRSPIVARLALAELDRRHLAAGRHHLGYPTEEAT